VLFGDSITEHSFRSGGWGAALADTYSRKVLHLLIVFAFFLYFILFFKKDEQCMYQKCDLVLFFVICSG